MRLYFACTIELISCMKGLCNIPAGQVLTNSVALSPGAMEKDKRLTEAFWLVVVAFKWRLKVKILSSVLSVIFKCSTWWSVLWSRRESALGLLYLWVSHLYG